MKNPFNIFKGFFSANGQAPDPQMAEANRRDKLERMASTGIVPEITSQRAVSLDEWTQAINLAKHPQTLSRWQLNRIYENVMLDLHVDSCIDTRVLQIQGSPFNLLDRDGNIDEEATKLLKTQWFLDFIQYTVESVFFGYSLIELYQQSPTKEIVSLRRGTAALNPLTEVTLIDRAHVRPELGKWYINHFDDISLGYDYTQPPASNFYIGVGKPKNLGKLMKIAPIAIAKRYALGAWSEFDEKLGIPFRMVTMQGQNTKREKLLASIMERMGSAGWGVFHEGEKIELLQAQGADPHKCFMELIKLLDAQISKSLLGQTMTTDDGSSRSQAEVHQETADIRLWADLEMTQHVVNFRLLPLLINRGYPLKGYTFEFDQTKHLPPQQQINIDQVLLQYYDLDPEYLSNKYNIPLDAIQPKAGVLVLQNNANPEGPEKKKP
jgi:hypothetical protein